jgi:uncharacterized protein (DUF1330 family)
MSCYMIVQAQVSDRAKFLAYTAVVPALVAQFGGRYLVLGGATTPLEGQWPDCKTVVSEWPDRASAQRFWDSAEYRAAARLREGAGQFTIVLVDGIQSPLSVP